MRYPAALLTAACVVTVCTVPLCVLLIYVHPSFPLSPHTRTHARPLLAAGVKPRQIGCVITNSSLFNPTPSLSATIMNHFKMPHTTINYNLGGMGCSAGLVAIDLAKQVLQLQPSSYVLVVSHENLTNNWYPGNDRCV